MTNPDIAPNITPNAQIALTIVETGLNIVATLLQSDTPNTAGIVESPGADTLTTSEVIMLYSVLVTLPSPTPEQSTLLLHLQGVISSQLPPTPTAHEPSKPESPQINSPEISPSWYDQNQAIIPDTNTVLFKGRITADREGRMTTGVLFSPPSNKEGEPLIRELPLVYSDPDKQAARLHGLRDGFNYEHYKALSNEGDRLIKRGYSPSLVLITQNYCFERGIHPFFLVLLLGRIKTSNLAKRDIYVETQHGIRHYVGCYLSFGNPLSLIMQE